MRAHTKPLRTCPVGLLLQGELVRVKAHAKQRDEYFENFANQLYR